jgi:hypothetical protein
MKIEIVVADVTSNPGSFSEYEFQLFNVEGKLSRRSRVM